ncbi:MAG: c-type cytochrome [Syntrophothermus sp.]
MSKWPKQFVIWVTVLSLLAFIILSVDSLGRFEKRTPPISPSVVEGKKVWQAKSCIDCHTILGNGAYFAPDLTKEMARRDAKWVAQFLTNPKAAMSTATMPNLRLNKKEVDDLIEFLEWTEHVNTNGWPPSPKLALAASGSGNSAASTDPRVAEGRQVYAQSGCASCHAINGQGGNAGPDLSHVGAIKTEEWLMEHFEDPARVVPGSTMPSFASLGKEKLEELTAYLLTLK